MDDIVTFLRARLDEDEAVMESVCWDTDMEGRRIRRKISEDDQRRVFRRELAEVEAKRRIVEDMSFYWRRYPEGLAAKELADRTLANLALPYAAHPDYDEAWKVE